MFVKEVALTYLIIAIGLFNLSADYWIAFTSASVSLQPNLDTLV